MKSPLDFTSSFCGGIRRILLLMLVSAGTTHAAFLFQENFDNTPPYTDNASLPTGLNTINYGYWSTNPIGSSTSLTSTAQALSGTRSLELKRRNDGGVSVLGYLGKNNTAPATTTESIVLRYAFYLVNNTVTETYVRDSAGLNLGYLQIVSNDGVSYVRSQYAGGAKSTNISISLNTWYFVELAFPATPDAAGTYSMSIFQSDGATQIGTTQSGAFFATPSSPTNYRYFGIYNEGPNSTVYIDDISVQTVPEPGTYALLAGGLLLAARRFRSSRFSM